MSHEDCSMPPPDRRLRQGAVWRIRFRECKFTERHHERWEAWIDVPENQRAFAVIEDIWEELFGEARVMRRPYETPPPAASKPAEKLKELLLKAAFDFDLRPRRAIWMMANVAVLVVVLGALAFSSNVAPATTRIEMAVDPPQRPTVEEKLTQTANSFETTPLTEGQRIVELPRGKAVFRGSPDPRQSTIVTTDLLRIAAAGGAQFSVNNTDESIEVTVSEGTVQLMPIAPGTNLKPGVALIVRKNEKLILSRNNAESMQIKVAARAAFD